ncbi:MAG TPA: hypothetical protein VGA36_04445 [Nitriliruptorales bacterium]
MIMDVEPTDAQLERFARELGDDGPVVMVNLNRYRERAAYPDGTAVGDRDVSGRQAYDRYGAVALRATAEVGARPLWGAPAAGLGPLIGDDEADRWDEILCIWYPSRAAFLRMLAIDWYADALVHRRAALERAVIFPVAARSEPVLDLSTLAVGA